MLATVGDLLEDVVVRVAAEPLRGTDTPAQIERRRGGSAANVAAAAAGAGAEVRFIGRVGDDQIGELLVADLASSGVDVRVQRAGRTGAVVVLVGPDGERTMLPDRGAAAELRDVDPSWVDGVSWLHIPCYSLLTEPIGSAATALVDTVRVGAGQISIDVSSVAPVESYGVQRFAELLQQVAPDVVFANADEAPYVPKGAWTAVVKHGPRPVRVLTEDGTFEVTVPDLGKVTDTTGAGDAFAAGYLVAASEGADPRAATAVGIDLAARFLQRG